MNKILEYNKLIIRSRKNTQLIDKFHSQASQMYFLLLLTLLSSKTHEHIWLTNLKRNKNKLLETILTNTYYSYFLRLCFCPSLSFSSMILIASLHLSYSYELLVKSTCFFKIFFLQIITSKKSVSY